MTELVREGLSKLESKCFSALLTYDVFQRDQVQALIDAKVTSPSDFDWMKHPKHYCSADELYRQPVHGKDDNYANLQNYSPEEYAGALAKAREAVQAIEDDAF